MCLAPGGRLVVTVPNMAGILGKIHPLLSNVPPHHVSRWTPEALARLAQHFFLKITETKYEPSYNFMALLLRERLHSWGVPDFFFKPKVGSRLLSLPGKLLRVFKPEGLEGLKGHTVYVVLRPEGGS
jgi:hypothetical protein